MFPLSFVDQIFSCPHFLISSTFLLLGQVKGSTAVRGCRTPLTPHSQRPWTGQGRTALSLVNGTDLGLSCREQVFFRPRPGSAAFPQVRLHPTPRGKAPRVGTRNLAHAHRCARELLFYSIGAKCLGTRQPPTVRVTPDAPSHAIGTISGPSVELRGPVLFSANQNRATRIDAPFLPGVKHAKCVRQKRARPAAIGR